MNKCIAVVLIFVISSFSQTFLSGEIKGVFPRDNYIITGDLSVKFGDTLSFKAGSELRFKPNTGLSIRGVFIAEGKIDNTIILTSAQEQEVRSSKEESKSKYWWKGIDLVASRVLSRFSYCLFCFCDTALFIRNTYQKVDLNHVVFHKNKDANLVWAGKTIETDDDVQYVYQMDIKDNIPPKDISRVKVGLGIEKRHKSPWKIMGRTTFSIVSLAGAGMWIYGYKKSEEYHKQYMDHYVPYSQLEADQPEVIRLREKRDQMVDFGNAGIAMLMIGTGAFIVTFLF